MKSNLVELSVCKHWETPTAVLVSETGDRSKAVWLPLSKTETYDRPDGNLDIVLPRWLAREKGLI